MIDTVLFDLDGTLLYTIEDLTDGVNHSMEIFGYPTHSVDAVRRMVGNGIRNLIIRAIPGGESDPNFEKAFQAFRDYYTENCMVKTKPYDGIMDVLQKLKKSDIKTAIVTNKNHQAAKRLGEYFFTGLVDITVGQQEHMNKKPEPDMVNQALKELGSTLENAVYVGDSEVDYETARRAGMKGIIVSWGFRDLGDLEKLPDVVIAHTTQELLAML